MPFPRAISDERGFTIVEVMVAALLLMTGLVGTMTMLDQANATTTTTKAREQGVSLQRELVEAARSISYSELDNATIVSRLQAREGFADANGAENDWVIRRRGVNYSVTLGTCSVDDTTDGTGPHDPAQFCTTGAGQATAAGCRAILGTTGNVAGTAGASATTADCGVDVNRDGTIDSLVAGGSCTSGCGSGSDTNPDDYKRVVSLVRWDRGGGNRYALQAATMPNPGLSAAPSVVSITPSTTTAFAGTRYVDVGVVTNRAPATVGISIDGSPKGAATKTTGPLAWNYTWDLGALAEPVATAIEPAPGEVLDGTYVVSARALDAYGSAGTTRAVTVTVNRRSPYPVGQFRGGRRGGATGEIDFEWVLNRERDVNGYRVFRDVPDTTADVEVCARLPRGTACRLVDPPQGNSEYYAVAYDLDPGTGAERPGVRSANFQVTTTNAVPAPITSLQASNVSGGHTKLIWTASAGDPDAGDSIAYYRIYRDGTAYENRFDRTTTGGVVQYTDTQSEGTPHNYYVAAVDKYLGESTIFGPVRR